MKRISMFLITALVTTSALAQHAFTFEDMMKIRRIGAPQLSPDGKWIAYDASTMDVAANARRSAVYLMPSTGGASTQLTSGTKQDDTPAWSPDGKTLAYLSNTEGGAKQIYLMDVATKATKKLTDLPNGASSIKWVPNGSGLVFTSDVYPQCGADVACHKKQDEALAANKSKARIITSLLYRHWTMWQEPTRTHILHVALNGGAVRDLTPGNFNSPQFSVGGGDEFEVSPDSRELVYSSDVSPAHAEVSTNSDVYTVPLVGGDAKRITTRTGADTSPTYSPDGKWIAWRSQSRAGYESDLWELWLYNRATGETMRLAPEFADWIESAAWGRDGKSLFITAPQNGRDVIFEVPLKGAMRQVFVGGAPSALTMSRDGKTLYFDMATISRANEIYSLTSGGKLTRLTAENDALYDSIRMGEVSSVTWTGGENATVQGWLVKPPMFDATKKYPAIVLIHGGPQGAWGDAWTYRWNAQLFAAQGYVILMPNPRGSSGFGQKFVEQISGDWGGLAYTDIMNGVDMFAALPYVDANRMGAAGASYGGYMVNWLLGHTDRFKAFVSHAGVYNLESMYGVTEETWFPEWEFRGNPWDNPELYAKWSPNRFVKNFKTPTLVTHGEIDFRVPVDQGMQLFNALQRRDVPSKLILFPDEGHWLLKPANAQLWYANVFDWFGGYLKK